MIDIEPFQVRLSQPLQTAGGSISAREGFLIRVEHGGQSGIGEATPLLGWTESYDECQEALAGAARIAEELDWGVALAKLDAPAARHGVSLAFADALASANEQPLYQSLGSEVAIETVPVNATLGADGSPEAVAERATEAVASGFRTLKLKVGTNGIEEDIERVRALREAVGDEVAIRVDANGAWTLEQARRATEALDALDVEYVEQPLPTAELSAHSSLRGSVDIALDESLAAHDIDTILEADAADVLILKPMVVGGPDRALEIAMEAHRHGVDIVISNTIDAVVARTGAVHVAASIPNVRTCGLATASMLETDLGPDPAVVRDGDISVPQGNGLGLPVPP